MKFRTLAALAGAAAATTLSLSAQAALVYSNLPATTPPNVPSLGYQATSTSEFGDHVQLAAGGRGLNTVTVMMSSWALASDYGSSDPGFEHDLTFSLYNYTGDAAAGSLIAAKTITTVVPWRPAADPTCAGGTGWRAGDGNCYNGYAFNVVFDFSADGIVLPDELVFGLSFNTQSYGDNPTGTEGGFNSLNFGLVAAAPSVGTDVDPDSVFWNTSHQPLPDQRHRRCVWCGLGVGGLCAGRCHRHTGRAGTRIAGPGGSGTRRCWRRQQAPPPGLKRLSAPPATPAPSAPGSHS